MLAGGRQNDDETSVSPSPERPCHDDEPVSRRSSALGPQPSHEASARQSFQQRCPVYSGGQGPMDQGRWRRLARRFSGVTTTCSQTNAEGLPASHPIPERRRSAYRSSRDRHASATRS